MGEDKPPRYVDDNIPVTMIIGLRDGTTKAQTVAIPTGSEPNDVIRLLLKTYDDLYLAWTKSKREPIEGISREGFEQEYEI